MTESKRVNWDFVVPEVTRPALHTLVGYPSLPACLPNCSVPMKPTKSKKYMLTLSVINQMGIRSQVLSNRQRAPPSVYPIANRVRAPPRMGRRRVKDGVAAFERRPWMCARQGHRQSGDRLRRRVDMERP